MKYGTYSLIQIVGIFCIFMSGCFVSTYYVASKLGLPIELYSPFNIFVWNLDIGDDYPETLNIGMGIVIFGVIFSIIFSYLIGVLRSHKKSESNTFGSAKWMTDKELKKSNLVAREGVFLGKKNGSYLRHDGPEHVIAFAPTRSGKGVGLVIPTLLSWKGSVLVHDIKGENWQITSGWRSQFSHCIYFNPTSKLSAKFNPLYEVRKGDNEIRDVQNIADILVDPDGAADKRDHWSKTGHALLVATILHILYAEEDKTLSGVANFLSDPRRSIRETFDAMMKTNHLGDTVHPVVASSVREMLNKSDNELSGVLSTTMSFLGLYRDPIVASATSDSDFRVADLMNCENPLSLYLVVPPSDLSRTKPLIRLILNQVGRLLTEKEITSKESYKHRLLMMIDEFPTLGRLDFFESSLAYLAGYGVKCYLIAQSLNQIDKFYGRENAILDNCHTRVAFSSNDDRTSRRISDLLGQKTEVRQVVNHSGNKMQASLNHISVSSQESARALLTPGEIGTLPSTDSLIFQAGSPPVYAEKITYYNDPNFEKRLLEAPSLDSESYEDVPQKTKEIVWLNGDFVRQAELVTEEEYSEEDEIIEDIEGNEEEEFTHSEHKKSISEGLIL